MYGEAIPQTNTIASSSHDSDIMYGSAAFPTDRSISTAPQKDTNASILINNSRFGVLADRKIDIVSFASLLIFSRMQNLEHVSAWCPKSGTTSVDERVSATFSPSSTLIHAFTSLKKDIAPIPGNLDFAILRPMQSIDAATSLTVDLTDIGAHLTLTSKKAQLSAVSAKDFLEKISLIVMALVDSPNTSCSELSLVTDTARGLMPDLSRAIEVKSFENVPERFLRIASQYADQAAISVSGEYYSYDELARIVRYISTRLTTSGVRPGDIVAVSGFMSMGTVAAMIATMAAGGVMVTVDHALPKERQALILDISRPRFLINVRPQAEQDDGRDNEIVVPDRMSHAQIAALPECPFTPPSLSQDASAYVFFTSGSSGAPKGVEGAHLGLAHFLDWQRSNFPIGPGDRAAQITALSFDVVLRDVLFPLTSGACLYLPDRGAALDARRFLRWLSDNKITAMHCVPSLMKAWLKGVDEEQPFASIKLIFFAGEPLTGNLLNSFIRAASKYTTIVNLYGPTETTLAKLAFKAARIEPGVQPVGTPQPGVDVAIVRNRRSICGLWEMGEIAIRTPYRSKGYLANEELTRQVFLPNPFADDASDLIYFTGDLGRLRPDGMIEIFGRIDSQIKIRGVRIEPNEIESHILKLPGIRDAAVTVHDAGNDEKILTALVVSDPPIPEDQHVEFGRSIRDALKTQLIDAMVPSRIIVLENLPYLPNGKIDRQQLRRIDQARLDTEAVSPDDASGETEQRLLNAFRAQLRSKSVTLDSSFESLGGDSLSYVTVYLALEDILGEPPPQWTGMTVRELSRLAHKPARGMLVKIDSLILLRAASIAAVVGNHFGISYDFESTNVLMLISGYMLGNIQIKEMLKSNTIHPIISSIRRMLLQYFVLMAPMISKSFIQGAPAWAALLLLNDVADGQNSIAHQSTIYWYIHCLFHILIIYAAIYVILTKFCPGRKATIWTLIACCGIGIVGRDTTPLLFGANFHTRQGNIYSDIFYVIPTSHIATFAIGALSTMTKRLQKLALAVLFIFYALAGLSSYSQISTAIFIAGGLWIMFAPRIFVPRLAAPVLYNVAGASMFIYLLHWQLKNITEHMSKAPPVALIWVAAIAAGVAAWRLWNLGAQILPQRLARLGAWRKFRGGLDLRVPQRRSVPRPTL